MTPQPPGPNLTARNLPGIPCTTLRHRPVTLLNGDNHTAAAWTLQAAYHMYRHLRDLPQGEMPEDLPQMAEVQAAALLEHLNVPPETLQGATLTPTDVHDLHRAAGAARAAASIIGVPQARTGVHLLHRELSSRRTSLLHQASRPGTDLRSLLQNTVNTRYSRLVADYIDTVSTVINHPAPDTEERRPLANLANRTAARVTGGGYLVNHDDGAVHWTPARKAQGSSPKPVPLHAAPPGVNSLFGPWLLLRHRARPGDLLFIEHPEDGLSEEQQQALAQGVIRATALGVGFMLSTSSTAFAQALADASAQNHNLLEVHTLN